MVNFDERGDHLGRMANNDNWQLYYPGLDPKLRQTLDSQVCPGHQALQDQKTISFRNQETTSKYISDEKSFIGIIVTSTVVE